MASVKRYLKAILILLVIAILGYSFVNFYSVLFARRVVGRIEKVERVQLNVALMQTSAPTKNNDNIPNSLYSFAVAIRDDSGEIVTASAEDRQWAVAQAGQCAEAKFYPYPPWQLDKAGTYFGARLLKLHDCSQDAH